MKNIDFFQGLPKVTRGERITKRAILTDEQKKILKEYDEEYFDGAIGYNGYYYDGRWKPVAEEMIAHYKLSKDSSILEVGCAKGFLMYEFYKLGIKNVFGCDISSYAISKVPEEIASNFRVLSATHLEYPDAEFDLVLTIDCIHNLDHTGVDCSIKEMMRVSKRDNYIRVGSYRTEKELENIMKWGVTSLTFNTPDEWLERFRRLNYKGDYYFRFMETLE